jgi:asparagine synthase (glutamine-hydrolysing)
VQSQLVSDVPLGAFLSGGVDSSLVVAAMGAAETFSIGFDDPSYNETQWSKRVADHLGVRHHVEIIRPQVLELFEHLMHFMDDPIGDFSIFPTYLVSKLARQHVKVVLSGDGGDELFGGYPHVRQAVTGMRLAGWVPQAAWSVAANLAERLPVGVKGRNRALSWRQGPLLERVWGTPWFDRKARERLFTADARAALGDALVEPELRQRTCLGDPVDPVDALCRLDFTTTLADDFLVKVDRASMMSSLEVRAPFLDMRLVAFAFAKVPSAWKCDGRETRRIERRLARRWLPHELDIDRKQGFSVPLGDWFRTAGRAAVRARMDGLPEAIDRHAVDAEIEGHMAGRNNGSRLFALAVLAECTRKLRQAPTTP